MAVLRINIGKLNRSLRSSTLDSADDQPFNFAASNSRLRGFSGN
jgi:hypothetical protein